MYLLEELLHELEEELDEQPQFDEDELEEPQRLQIHLREELLHELEDEELQPQLDEELLDEQRLQMYFLLEEDELHELEEEELQPQSDDDELDSTAATSTPFTITTTATNVAPGPQARLRIETCEIRVVCKRTNPEISPCRTI